MDLKVAVLDGVLAPDPLQGFHGQSHVADFLRSHRTFSVGGCCACRELSIEADGSGETSAPSPSFTDMWLRKLSPGQQGGKTACPRPPALPRRALG